jgi:glutathione peroxidase
MTDLLTTPVTTLHDEPTTFAALTGGRTALVVNVASKCGLTPQYAGLEELHRELSDRAFTVVGFPCNQFGGQEPGSAEEIETFCSETYGVTFPMSAKIDVNGPDRDPVYDVLTATPDDKGEAGDIQWNFEKFLVSPDGQVLRRFRPMVEPDAAELREAVEAALAG